MAKARRKAPEWHLGAVRVVVSVCLIIATIALSRVAPQSQLTAGDAGDRESVIPAGPVSRVSWRVHEPAPLFGLTTEPVAGQVGAKWRGVAADIEAELDVLARCRAGEACPDAALALMKIVDAGAGRNGLARVGLINRAVDLAITPTSDQAQWGVADRWSPPFETLATHRGDCEDYAIVKYAALLAAGVSRDDVKVVILHNLSHDEDHAVAAARVDGAWLILDNSKLALVRDTDMTGALPRFVLDAGGARRFVDAGRNGQRPSLSRRIEVAVMREALARDRGWRAP
ncbi:transglutaminase-like cysteine peptidase [Bradyrhizobium sp. Tv2a-2]|uniref:transglutaminase-like cysteine peptidase n=1 Tax=Bradyrhizobium sp. Tv2a-2 TaxID=113395 RepID=UPI000463084D|nr:transglutaminase-like cysteine peptidase [Bradyrhizobium sp. Tv2a-2]